MEPAPGELHNPDIHPDMPRDIHMGNAHRYMLPFPEVGAALAIALTCMRGGTLEVYRNNSTGGLMLAMTCQGCDKHHPLVEVHVIDEPLDENDRFIMQARGCAPYHAFLEASGGTLLPDMVAHQPSRELIASLSDRQADVKECPIGEVYEELPGIVMEVMRGGATFALDRLTGRTAVGYECKDCQVVHGVLALEMPKPDDMRMVDGYSYLGNPFLDLMLEDAGEVRH